MATVGKGNPVSQPIGKGRPLKPLKPGQIIGSGTANALINFYNAFINLSIVDGTSNQMFFGDLAILLQIRGGGTNGVAGMVYRGEYTPDGHFSEFFPGLPYVLGHVVLISPGNVNATTSGGAIIPGHYICVKSSPTDSDLPNHPMSDGGETAFWRLLSTYPMASTVCDGGESVDVAVDQQRITPAEEE